MRARSFLKLPCLAALACALLLAGCGGKGEPVGGVFGYAWGTSMDAVLADSADIAQRLSEPGFKISRQSHQLILTHVQYGLGFGDLRLDFDENGKLWHGVIRVPADARAADSIRDQWRDHHGSETSEGRIDTDSGYTTIWATGSTVDRHFFAPGSDARNPGQVRALELFHGGCLEGCPLYSVRFFPDGTAIFLGLREVDPLGGCAGKWPAERWNELAGKANAQAVWSLEPEFSPTAERGEARRGLATLLETGERRTWTSVNQSGPPALEGILATLDSVASSVVWDRSMFTWDTLDVRAVQWLDLDSLEQMARR